MYYCIYKCQKKSQPHRVPTAIGKYIARVTSFAGRIWDKCNLVLAHLAVVEIPPVSPDVPVVAGRGQSGRRPADPMRDSIRSVHPGGLSLDRPCAKSLAAERYMAGGDKECTSNGRRTSLHGTTDRGCVASPDVTVLCTVLPSPGPLKP